MIGVSVSNKMYLINLVLAMSVSFDLVAEKLRVGTVIAAPYQMQEGTNIYGSVVEIVQCAMDRSDVDFDLVALPWNRMIKHLEDGHLDFIFSLERDVNIERFATHTIPLVLEKWFWVTSHEVDLNRRTLPIAVVLGSNQEKWLKTNQYLNVFSVSSTQSALNMVKQGRVATMLVDELILNKAAKDLGLKLSQDNQIFNRFSVLSAYVSKHYLEQLPRFLETLNKNIIACGPIGIELDQQSHEVLTLLAEKLAYIQHDDILLEALKKANALALSRADILSKDGQWLSERRSEVQPLISSVKGNLLSQYLLQFMSEYGDLFSEIFVTDKNGLVIGLSHVTSDFWQGDEEKFTQVFSIESPDVFINDIQYDESSHAFIAQISIVIKGPDSLKNMGVFVFGVNVEAALRNQKFK